MTPRTFCAVVTALITAAPARGGEAPPIELMPIEQLMEVRVTAAQKLEETAADTPASVTVVTAEEIAAHGWRSLAEILAAQAGFSVFSDRIYDFVVPRGFYLSNDPDSRLLLLLDGHRMVEPFGYFNGHLPTVDVSQIDRVEIVRGPVSAVYGTNAVFGVVNVVTRGAPESGLGEARIEAGNFGHGKLAVRAGRGNGRLAPVLLLSGERGGEEPLFFPEYAAPRYPTGGHTGAASDRMTRLTVRLALDAGPLKARAYYGRRRKRVPTGIYGGKLDDERTFFEDENAFLELRADWQAGLHEGWVKAYADRYRFTGRFGYAPDPAGITGPPYGSEFNRIESGQWGGEALWRASWNARQRTVAGLEWRRYSTIDFLYTSEDGPPPTLREAFRRDPGERILSLSLSHQLRFGDGWLAEAGLHHDDYASVGGKTALRGALDWTPRDDLRLKLLYGEAHRAPNDWERDGGFFLAGNRDLRPDFSSTLELLARKRLSARAALRLSLFRTALRGTIEKDLAAARFANTRGYRADGIETEWEYLGEASRASASASFSSVKRRATGERIEFAPRWTLKARWDRRFTGGGTRLALEAEGVGDRLTGKRDEPKLPAYGLLHLSISEIRLGDRLTASLTVRNLLDKQYDHPAFLADLATYYQNAFYPVYRIPAEGRALVLALSGKF